MLGHRGLGDAEFGLHRRGHRPRSHLAVGEQFEDAPAHRVAEDVERVHGTECTAQTYISTTLI
nr:hypothetical protein [Micromonospora sp. DSM 115978]